MTESFRVEQIDHVEFFVPSRREAAAWYERALGLTIISDAEHWAENTGGPLMIATRSGGTKLALFRAGIHGDPPGDRASAGFYRVAFRVGGVEFLSALDHLPSVPVLNDENRPFEKLEPYDHGSAFSVYFRDPWGHRLEITTYEPQVVRETVGY